MRANFFRRKFGSKWRSGASATAGKATQPGFEVASRYPKDKTSCQQEVSNARDRGDERHLEVTFQKRARQPHNSGTSRISVRSSITFDNRLAVAVAVLAIGPHGLPCAAPGGRGPLGSRKEPNSLPTLKDLGLTKRRRTPENGRGGHSEGDCGRETAPGRRPLSRDRLPSALVLGARTAQSRRRSRAAHPPPPRPDAAPRYRCGTRAASPT
jgi:hypothetical protein